MKKIVVIVPVLNEELIVEELISRLQKAVSGLNYRFEFVIVDDGSRDGTLQKLLVLQRSESRLKIIRLSRNWGHQNAFNAGIDNADGDATVLMDGDLEDPPELIPEFIKKWEEGFECVYAVKTSRQRSFLAKMLFALFYKLFKYISYTAVDEQAGIFSLMDKKVFEALKRCSEKNKYYVGLRFFLGYKQVAVPYSREKRYAGAPKQSVRKLLNDALNAYFSLSFLPIRILTYFGLVLLGIISLVSIALIAINIFHLNFWFMLDLPGWTSIVLLCFFILGAQIVFMGVLGEYIARIYDEVRSRPYYVVAEVYSADNAN